MGDHGGALANRQKTPCWMVDYWGETTATPWWIVGNDQTPCWGSREATYVEWSRLRGVALPRDLPGQ
jgi:hypothetical protein